MFFYRWKYSIEPDVGLFSTVHAGDAAGNFIRGVTAGFVIQDTAVVDGQTIVLEFDQIFTGIVGCLLRVQWWEGRTGGWVGR